MKLYCIGIGPGGAEQMTLRAVRALEKCDCVAGYGLYLDLIAELIEGKERIQTGMTKEVDRCTAARDAAADHTPYETDTAVNATEAATIVASRLTRTVSPFRGLGIAGFARSAAAAGIDAAADAPPRGVTYPVRPPPTLPAAGPSSVSRREARAAKPPPHAVASPPLPPITIIGSSLSFPPDRTGLFPALGQRRPRRFGKLRRKGVERVQRLVRP